MSIGVFSMLVFNYEVIDCVLLSVVVAVVSVPGSVNTVIVDIGTEVICPDDR